MDFSGESGTLKNRNLPMEDRLDRSCRKKLDIIRTLTLGRTSPKDLGLCVTWLGILCRSAKKEAQERDCLMELMLRQLQETGHLSLPFTDITNCVRNLSELLTPEGLGQPQLRQPTVSRENNNDNTQQYQWREKLHQLDQLEVLYKHGEWIDSASTTKSEEVRLPAGTEKGSGVLRVKAAVNEVRFTDKPMPPTKSINKSLPTKPRVSPAEGTSARQRQDRELRILEINLRKEKERLDREFRAKQREQERAQLAEQIRLDREQMLTGQQVWQQQRRRLQEKVQARIEHERNLMRKKREEQREQDERSRERLQRDQLAWKQMHRKRREMERIDRMERARLLTPKEEFVTILAPKKRMESRELQSAEKVISWMVLCPSCRDNVVNIPSQSILHSPEQQPQVPEEASSKSISQGSYINIKETRQTKHEEHLRKLPDPDRKECREIQQDNRLECDQGPSTLNNLKRIRQLQKEQIIEMVKLIRQSRDDQAQKRVLPQELELKRRAEQANPTALDSELFQMDQVAGLKNIQGFPEKPDSQRFEEQSKKKEELELALKQAELMEKQLLQKLEQERKEKEDLEKKMAQRLENLNIKSKETKVIEEKNSEIEECGEENVEKSQGVQARLINSLNKKQEESPSVPKEAEKAQEKIIKEKPAEMGNKEVLKDNTKIYETKQQETTLSPKEKDYNKESEERESKKKVKYQETQGDNTNVDENKRRESPLSIKERERPENNRVIEERESKKKRLEAQDENTKVYEKNQQESPERERQAENPFGDRKSQKENQKVLDNKTRDDEKKNQETVPHGSSIPLSLLLALGRKWEEMERKNKEKEREKNREKQPKISIEEKSPREMEEEDKENYDYESLQKKERERTVDAIFKRKVEREMREKGHKERIEKDEEYNNALEDKRKVEEKLLRKRAQDNMRRRLHGKSENIGPDAIDLKKNHKGRLCSGREEYESKDKKKANEENNELEISISNVEDRKERELRRKVRRTEAVEERERVTLDREEMERVVRKQQQEKESLLIIEKRSMDEASRQEVMVQMERKAQIERRVNEDLEKKAMQELLEAEKEFRKQEQLQVEHLQKMREQSKKGKEEMHRLFQHYTSFWKNRNNDGGNEMESEGVQRKPEEEWCQEGPASSPEMEPERLERRNYSSKDTKSETEMKRNRRVTQGLEKPVNIQIRQMLRNNDYRTVLGEGKENELRNMQDSPTYQHSTSRSERSEAQIGHRSEAEEEIPPGDVAPKPTNIRQFIQQRRHELEVSLNKPFAGRFEGGSQCPCYLRHHSPIRELNRRRTEETWLKVDRDREQRVRSIERLDQKLDSERRSLEGEDKIVWTPPTDRSQETRDRPESQGFQPQNFKLGPLGDRNRCFGEKKTIRCHEPRVRRALQRSAHQNYQKIPHNPFYEEEQTPIGESSKEIISSSSSGNKPGIRFSLLGRFCPERRTYIVGPNEKQSQSNRNQGGQESTRTDTWNLTQNSRPKILKPRQDKCQPYESRNSSNTDVTHAGRSLLQSSTKVCNTKCNNFHMAFLESAKRIIAVLRASNANPSSSESSEECARHLGQKLPEPIFRNLAEPLLESSQDLAQNLVAIVSTLDDQLVRHVGHLRKEWNCFLDQRRTVMKLQNQLRQVERDQMVASSRASVFNVLIQWWKLNRSTVNLLKDLFSEYCDLGDPLVKETLDTIEWFYGEWSLQKLVFEYL